MIHRGTDIKAALRSRQRGFLLNPFRFSGGSGGTTPASLPGLSGWYDASAAAARTVVSGKISQWDDLSGNGNHATQPTSGSRYTLAAASVNGLDAFTGARSAQMGISEIAGLSSAGAYFFCVGGAVAETPFVAAMGSFDKSLALDLAPGGSMYAWGDGAGNYITMAGIGAATSDGSINAFAICSSSSGSSSTAAFNAARYTGGALPGVLSINGITNYTQGGDYTLNGTICEIFFGAAHLTTEQINGAMDYLKAKWGTP